MNIIVSFKYRRTKGLFIVLDTTKIDDVYSVFLIAEKKEMNSDSFVAITQEKSYYPTTDEITKVQSILTTEKDVTEVVTVPNYPSEKGILDIAVNDSSILLDGNTTKKVNILVTVTYPNSTIDYNIWKDYF